MTFKLMAFAWASILVSMGATGVQCNVVRVRIEVLPDLAEATARARIYAADLPDVNRFPPGGAVLVIKVFPEVL